MRPARSREGERGYTLAELLVALLLMSVVLGAAAFVELVLLRKLERERAAVPAPEVILAARRIARDVREATDVVPAGDLSSVPGAKLLLVERNPVGADVLTLYRTQEGALLRSRHDEDGEPLDRERRVLADLVACEMDWVPALDLVIVSLARAPGGLYRGSFAVRADPSVLPPPGWGAGGGDHDDGEGSDGGPPPRQDEGGGP